MLLVLPKFILYAYLIYQVYKYEMAIFSQKKRNTLNSENDKKRFIQNMLHC